MEGRRSGTRGSPTISYLVVNRARHVRNPVKKKVCTFSILPVACPPSYDARSPLYARCIVLPDCCALPLLHTGQTDRRSPLDYVQ